MNLSHISLDDRMKYYEKQDPAHSYLLHNIPVLARLDGKCFHSFTRGMRRPYDEDFCQLMRDTTAYLVKETNARVGYTQSDEITLLYYSNRFDSQIYFNGRRNKMCSVLASMCAAYFNKNNKLNDTLAAFDCRVWNVPSKSEAANVFVWREQDATRNSIQMMGSTYFSSKELHKKSTNMIQDMVWQKFKVNWNDYPRFFKRGSYFQRKNYHTGNKVVDLNLPILTTIDNREEVLFDKRKPILRQLENV